MELTEEYLNKKMPQILQVFEEFEIEDTDALLENLKEEYKKVSERKSSSILPQDAVFNKALGKVVANLGVVGAGEKFNVFIMAYSNPRDWNKEAKKAILDAWEKGPKAREKLKQEGKIATITKQGEKIVVSKITKFNITSETKKFVPIAGEEIKEGEEPVPIDTREKLENGKKNKRITYPLIENWSLNIFGLVEIKDRYIPFELSVYDNKLANPYNEKFLPKVYPPFYEYTIVASINEDKTKDDLMSLQFLNGIQKLKQEVELTGEEAIYGLMGKGEGFLKPYKKYQGQIDKFSERTIYLVDIDQIRKFHDEFLGKKGKSGNILKTPSGYDKTLWNRFGIGIYYCLEKTETQKGNYRLVFRDHSGETITAFTSDYQDEPQFKEYPQEALISFSTTKKPTRWDSEAKVSIDDPINGDINIGSILGIRVLEPYIRD